MAADRERRWSILAASAAALCLCFAMPIKDCEVNVGYSSPTRCPDNSHAAEGLAGQGRLR